MDASDRRGATDPVRLPAVLAVVVLDYERPRCLAVAVNVENSSDIPTESLVSASCPLYGYTLGPARITARDSDSPVTDECHLRHVRHDSLLLLTDESRSDIATGRLTTARKKH